MSKFTCLQGAKPPAQPPTFSGHCQMLKPTEWRRREKKDQRKLWFLCLYLEPDKNGANNLLLFILWYVSMHMCVHMSVGFSFFLFLLKYNRHTLVVISNINIFSYLPLFQKTPLWLKVHISHE